MAGPVALVVSGLLLVSMGGAIVAAPMTLPVLFLAARHHPGAWFRRAAAVVVGLTAAEVAWAVSYMVGGESRPWIWLVPLVAGGAGAAVFVRYGRPAGEDGG